MRERGITKLDIVLDTINDTEVRWAGVRERLRSGDRLSVAERDYLGRRLAGVVGNCESIRVWLSAGAPK